MTLSVCNIKLYSNYLPYAILDGIVKTVQFQTTDSGDGDIQVTIPHFWEYAIIDPDYSVLVETSDDACYQANEKSVSVNIIIGVFVGFFGVACILVAVWFIFHRCQFEKLQGTIKRRIAELKAKEQKENLRNARKQRKEKPQPTTQREQYLRTAADNSLFHAALSSDT